MPKTLSSTQNLTKEIETLQAAIALKQSELLEQKSEVAEFTESLRIFSLNVDKYVPQGRLAAMDAINTVLDEAINQKDRNYRWNACQQASQLAQEAAVNLQSELERLQSELAAAIDKQDWLINYAPFTEKYRSGFQQPSPKDLKNSKVADLKADISQRKAHQSHA